MPEMLRVDPGNTVLKEIAEHKPRDMWAAQLRRDPDLTGRIAAAKELGKAHGDQSRALLAEVLAADPFWAVRTECAQQLAAMGGDDVRDALIAGLGDSNHKVRRQCVESLRKFRDDEKAIAAVKRVVSEGDASYRVEADAISSYARMGASDAFEVITPALSRDSHREMVRSAVLGSLDELGAPTRPAAIDLLIEWTAAGKPAECRRTAVDSLASVAANLSDGDAGFDRAVAVIADALTSGDGRLQSTAARALERLGGRAMAALPALRTCQSAARSDRLREAVGKAIDAIQKDNPAHQQLADLRKELDDLKKENERLAASVHELEARVKAFGSPAGGEGHRAAADGQDGETADSTRSAATAGAGG
jgi:aminopeptidase N